MVYHIPCISFENFHLYCNSYDIHLKVENIDITDISYQSHQSVFKHANFQTPMAQCGLT